MKQKEITKTILWLQNEKNSPISMVYKNIFQDIKGFNS